MAEQDNQQQQPQSILPQFMQMLMQGGGQQPQQAPEMPQGGMPQPPAGGAMPPTSPVQQPSQPGGGFDLASTVKQVSALPEYSGPSKSLEDIAGRERGIEQQQKDLPIPQMGFKPHFGGGFFHNLGQALIALAASTEPGQAVQGQIYGPDIRKYQAQRQGLASQLETLKGEEAIPTEEIKAVTGMTQAAGLAGYRGQQAQTNRMRVDAYAQSIKDRAQNFAATQDWRSASLDERKRANIINEAQKAADESGRNYRAQNRDATMEDVAQIVTGTKKEIANEAAARDPGVKSWLFNALGIDIPQVQSAPSPEFRETPKAGAPSAAAKPKANAAKGTIRARDAQGKLHEAPAGTALPQGWKLEK